MLAVRRTVPLRGCRHRAGVRREPDEHGARAVRLSNELADVQLAPLAHLGRARIAEMRVVRPDDHAGIGPLALEEPHQLTEGVDHVPIAEVPRVGAPAEHRAVVRLRVPDQTGILLGVEELVRGDPPVAARVGRPLTVQLDELCDDLPLAGGVQPQSGGVSVLLRLPAELIETGVALAGAPGRLQDRPCPDISRTASIEARRLYRSRP